VAESRRPALLFETGLPTRYYLPKADVRMDLLVPTTTETRCPYKGVASYYSVRTGETVVEDVGWYYRHPIPECGKIENLVCFFNERVDALYVDGALQPRPRTRWSVADEGAPAQGASARPGEGIGVVSDARRGPAGRPVQGPVQGMGAPAQRFT
jgi:uncharacterized protein (DUF427 family)